MQKIKSVITYKLEPEEENIENGFVNSILEYDKQGNVTKSIIYQSENEIESKTLAKYDEKGELIEEVNYMTEDEIAEKLTYKRDEKGNPLEVIVEYIDGSISIKKYEYSDDEVVVNIVDDEDEFEGKEIRKINAEGKLIEKIIYDEDNNLDERELITYDDKGNVINRKEFDVDNNPELEINYEYDDKDNLLKFIKTNAQGDIVDRVIFAYDDKGNMTEQRVGDYYYSKFFINPEEKSKTEERYDIHGTLQFILTTVFDNNDLIIEEITPMYTVKYKYEFYE